MGEKAAIRIGLSHGCEAARGNLTQLGIVLNIPVKLKALLQEANTEKNGFFGKSIKKGSPLSTFLYKITISDKSIECEDI